MYCIYCGHQNTEDAKFCDNCGKPITSEQLQPQVKEPEDLGLYQNIENNSGQGKTALLPPQLYGWNWGAFFLSWIWGIGNNTMIAFLTFIPLVNIVMIFVLGAKGNEWAWQNKRWQNIQHFKRVQRLWAIWGVIIFAVGMAFSILVIAAAIAVSNNY